MPKTALKGQKGRWMLTLECEVCGGIIKRSIQDITILKIGKHKGKCPHCRATITYKEGLLPKDLETPNP